MVKIDKLRVVDTCMGNKSLGEEFKALGLDEKDFKDPWWTEDRIVEYVEHFTCENDIRFEKKRNHND